MEDFKDVAMDVGKVEETKAKEKTS